MPLVKNKILIVIDKETKGDVIKHKQFQKNGSRRDALTVKIRLVIANRKKTVGNDFLP